MREDGGLAGIEYRSPSHSFWKHEGKKIQVLMYIWQVLGDMVGGSVDFPM